MTQSDVETFRWNVSLRGNVSFAMTISRQPWWALLVAAFYGLLSACNPFPASAPTAQPLPAPTPTATPTPTLIPTPVAPRYAVIAKSRGEYWENVARGARAAEKQLGLPPGSVVFYATEREDPAAQILAIEEFVGRGVRGIAIAPVEPRALELSIRQAQEAGVWVTTFDTDAPNSRRSFFVGTSQEVFGREAAVALRKLIGDRGGKVALGSTLRNQNANARIAALKEGLKPNTGLSMLDAANDRQNLQIAIETAKMAIASHKDLIGAFGVYAYNGVGWCRALQETKAADRVALVAVDVTAETVACLKNTGIDALVAPKPYAQGLQSVLTLDSLAQRGLLETANEFGVNTASPRADWVIDVGVDVISLDGRVGVSLAEYASKMDELGVPRDWTP